MIGETKKAITGGNILYCVCEIQFWGIIPIREPARLSCAHAEQASTYFEVCS